MATKADFPASYYGDVDGRNPVVRAFKGEVDSLLARMRRVTSEEQGYARGGGARAWLSGLKPRISLQKPQLFKL
ncbi:hypothetical protein N1851_021550 [Merluccius polli]|uniref:Uncharacterized protein n=1 Tax=Merluccius polli TaxID=89951 RepID=A0AA47MJU2_MERPO|nr:hypothetical protein N1851_021550 [Merluccius polli]